MQKIGEDILLAAEILKDGGLVAIPTETVYGLAANAMNEDAVLKIFHAKNRPFFDPLIVHTNDLNKVLPFLKEPLPPLTRPLADEYWPGPLSLVLEKKEKGFSDLITSGLNTVAIRIPRHPLTLKLLEILPFPLVAPSANPFGYVSPTRASHVADQLEKKVDYILDGGSTEVGIESTILDLSTPIPLLRRKGGISIEKLKLKIPDLEIADVSISNPSSPGMLEQHYSTATTLVMDSTLASLEYLDKNRTGALRFSTPLEGLPLKNQRILSEKRDLVEAAKNLFSFMRQLDKMDLDLIVVEGVPNEGLGRAINDKLKRATHR